MKKFNKVQFPTSVMLEDEIEKKYIKFLKKRRKKTCVNPSYLIKLVMIQIMRIM
jgi:hypothetical protein